MYSIVSICQSLYFCLSIPGFLLWLYAYLFMSVFPWISVRLFVSLSVCSCLYGTTQADWGKAVLGHFAWCIARPVAPEQKLVQQIFFLQIVKIRKIKLVAFSAKCIVVIFFSKQAFSLGLKQQNVMYWGIVVSHICIMIFILKFLDWKNDCDNKFC